MMQVKLNKRIGMAILLAGLSSGSLLTSAAALAGGDAAAGKAASQTCAACHGVDGNSTIPTNPSLAGQYESYLVQALRSYRDGSRQNPIMAGFASQLDDQQIADLAAYFAAQKGNLQAVLPK